MPVHCGALQLRGAAPSRRPRARAGFAAVYKGWPRTKPLKWVALLVFALATIAACTSFFFMKQARPRAACLGRAVCAAPSSRSGFMACEGCATGVL